MSRSHIVYVGNLPLDVKERELDDLFYKFGAIRHIDLKTPSRPPAFAFIEFEDSRDAMEAVRVRDGYDFYGYKIRVEMSHGGSRGTYGERSGGRDRDRDRDRDRSGRGLGPAPYGPSRRTEFRIIVKGLPSSCSWQDLKDHMRKAGEVTFAQVMRDGKSLMGLVDYATQEDMNYAIRKLDDSEFRNPFDSTRIRVIEDVKRDGGRSADRARSRSRSPARSYSRSRSRSKSRSVSRSRSRSRSRAARSPSRERSPPPRSRSRSPARSE